MPKLVGFLYSCSTPYCGGVDGYFCVRCRHYVMDCLCTPSQCACPDDEGWASTGERRAVLAKLARLEVVDA